MLTNRTTITARLFSPSLLSKSFFITSQFYSLSLSSSSTLRRLRSIAFELSYFTAQILNFKKFSRENHLLSKPKMIGPNFIDEIDCGSFFDHIDDLLDFPTDDVDAASFLPPSASCEAFPGMWSTHHESESLQGSDSVFSAKSASDLSAELSVPYEDIVQLEWLSNFVEDSFSGGNLTINNKEHSSSINNDSSPQQFRTSSPVSVLESSSSCSGGDKTAPLSPEAAVPLRCGRARSKRPRPATFNPRPPIQLISPTSSVTETPITPRVYSDCENFAESRPLVKMPKQTSSEQKKKKKMKMSVPFGPAENNQNVQAQSVRKCMHCEITKTPQWRAGPMGPKTLCNACGVRYKSGRLFPEYRPAASPTFVPAIHSNSHKKVLEMRNRFGERVDSAGNIIPETASPEMELIPNTNGQQLQLEYI